MEYLSKQCGESNSTQRSHRPQELVAQKLSPLLKWHSNFPISNLFNEPLNTTHPLSFSILHYYSSIHFPFLVPNHDDQINREKKKGTKQNTTTLEPQLQQHQQQLFLYLRVYVFFLNFFLHFLFKKEKEPEPK
ncbi:hypothetical protein RIF29_15949 [Crotalaria pallida]|uniref:Uncharacterized protein n=1 Tax=Crotalaria pallida TaxID=3830 RepID=A0AAN9FFL3_CROPI